MTRRTLTSIAATATLAVLVYRTARGIPEPPPPVTSIADPRYGTAIVEARAVLAPLLARFPAISVTVAVDGKLVSVEARGWADIATHRAATPATRFRLYSNAKPMTAALAVRLAEQKRVDLDAPIGTQLPDLPRPLAGLTLRQLLAHLAGVRPYGKDEWLTVSSRPCDTALQALAPFRNDPLVSPPGRRSGIRASATCWRPRPSKPRRRSRSSS